MALLKLPIAWFQFGIVFLAPPTDFWCRQPEDFKHVAESLEDWKKTIKPRDDSFSNDTVMNK